MTDILARRLDSLHISRTGLTTPAEVVRWLGAVQAQDYSGAKWSVGLRLPGMTDEGVEQALADRSIVRTWSLRGTLHLMAPEDIRWMLALIYPRMKIQLRFNLKRHAFSDDELVRCYHILEKLLRDGVQATRDEVRAALADGGITVNNERVNFILVTAAIEGLICQGIRRKKEFTFTLLDEWVAPAPERTREEALHACALRYFRSHGPATVADFTWWTGLTLTEARLAVELARGELQEDVHNGQPVWFAPQTPEPATNTLFLLPGFDEYLLGYTDRTDALPKILEKEVNGTSNGLFLSTVVFDGKIEGIWRRSFRKDTAIIEIKPFKTFSAAKEKRIEKVAGQFARYAGMKAVELVR